MAEQAEIFDRPVTEVTIDDGSVLKIGDEVTTNFHSKCFGEIFVIAKMIRAEGKSGVFVLAHIKDQPDRTLKGSTGNGLDANWFKKYNLCQ